MRRRARNSIEALLEYLHDTRPLMLGDTNMLKPVFRVSRGSFSPARFEAVRAAFDASRATLEPATQELPGHRMSYAAIDPTSGTIVYVSFWDTLDAAKQLDTLPEMRVAGAALIDLGVEFERPIVNYEILWSINS